MCHGSFLSPFASTGFFTSGQRPDSSLLDDLAILWIERDEFGRINVVDADAEELHVQDDASGAIPRVWVNLVRPLLQPTA